MTVKRIKRDNAWQFMLVINTVWRHLSRRPVFLPLLGMYSQGFPGGSEGKASSRNARDPCSIPGSGRSPGEGHGNPTPVFLPGESHGRRSLVVHGVAESRTWLSDFTFTFLASYILCACFLMCKRELKGTLRKDRQHRDFSGGPVAKS